ncbi:hypothetical protein HF086_000812 [Spodoptera exigua]|uniref:Uncharacterized protein n=1 Tax=Spodoptera exigua TaxID=7107 RepID=A0A922MEK4_SPOEX|nr:hypothetical protein HF086_000812 [Spodoptera exigua]
MEPVYSTICLIVITCYEDKNTGDSKTVQESRDGGTVKGYYSFIDADGKTRTVYYTADDKQGFRAKVQKTN